MAIRCWPASRMHVWRWRSNCSCVSPACRWYSRISTADRRLCGQRTRRLPGKSVLIAHLALAAAQRGRDGCRAAWMPESERIGAAAQMNALGNVFGYRVEHLYTPQELHALQAAYTPHRLVLVEAAGWSPSDSARQRAAWTWQLPDATNVVCVPATARVRTCRFF